MCIKALNYSELAVFVMALSSDHPELKQEDVSALFSIFLFEILDNC
jgi:hypothetical protein